ncbi:MAG: ABC transporter permease [Candidatus Moraniibacteriota bacterium]|nr:MAG: ABC transporter permease [Candidatus Moranbacteria bacterium]
MRVDDAVLLSVRMFKARAMRTFLTILGMSVGIGAVLFLVSIGYGLQSALLDRITTEDSVLTLDVIEAKKSVIPLNASIIEELEKNENVSQVSPAAELASQGIFDGVGLDIPIIATKPSFFSLGGLRINSGEFFSDENMSGVVVTSSLAAVFGDDKIIGKEIDLSFFLTGKENEDEEEDTLKQVESSTKYFISGIVQGEENIAYVHLNSLNVKEIPRYSALKVKCKATDKMASVRDSVLEKGFIVSSLSDTVDQANKIFSIIQVILLSFGIIALVVSAIGMFNTMTIALLERTEEIGIMKSIGAFNFDVSLLFVLESTIMGFLGGLGGVFLGQVGGVALNGLFNLIASRFGGQSVDLFYSPGWFVALIILIGAGVGFFTGFIPARRASKIDPLDALRYK